MLQELNEKRVTLMEGTALSERDLQRSRAESASAVFLLADRFSPNYQQEDLNVQFQVGCNTKGHPVCSQAVQHLGGMVARNADCRSVLCSLMSMW